MKLRDEGHLSPSGYFATRRRSIDPELLELARLSTIPVRTLQRWTPDRREHELARLRAEQEIQRAERAVRRRPDRPAPRPRASLATGHKPRGARRATGDRSPRGKGREWAGGG
jgi:hypothetical protein